MDVGHVSVAAFNRFLAFCAAVVRIGAISGFDPIFADKYWFDQSQRFPP
jgi:hypothetical protein